MGAFTTFKRWRLKEGQTEMELLALIHDETISIYEKLPVQVRLGLLRIDGTRSYLATQHWESREVHEEITSSDAYRVWLDAYIPTLRRRDTLMEFEEEWETEKMVL